MIKKDIRNLLLIVILVMFVSSIVSWFIFKNKTESEKVADLSDIKDIDQLELSPENRDYFEGKIDFPREVRLGSD